MKFGADDAEVKVRKRRQQRCMSQSYRQHRPSRGREAASPNFSIRPVPYHSSARSWAQPQPSRLLLRAHTLHFPAHLRCCWCVCFSCLCCSSGWAFYGIQVSVLFSTSIRVCCQRLTFLWTPFLQSSLRNLQCFLFVEPDVFFVVVFFVVCGSLSDTGLRFTQR